MAVMQCTLIGERCEVVHTIRAYMVHASLMAHYHPFESVHGIQLPNTSSLSFIGFCFDLFINMIMQICSCFIIIDLISFQYGLVGKSRYCILIN